jgi:hypothetical protein
MLARIDIVKLQTFALPTHSLTHSLTHERLPSVEMGSPLGSSTPPVTRQVAASRRDQRES